MTTTNNNTLGIEMAERGLVPERIVRWGIRGLLRRRLRQERASSRDVFTDGRIAIVPEKANEQHYEVPPEFFEQVLGPRLKYSSCFWDGAKNLAEAEEAMLALTCERADLEDGMEILELGCGWGSLTRWMSERYPNARILAMSNSAGQRQYIEELNLPNVEIITEDINRFDTVRRFDRVVSVEMFEHVRNHEGLLRRVASWLRDDGRLFIHVFCHRQYAYPFEDEAKDDWMSRHFFSGGLMPSARYFRDLDRDLKIERQWNLSGEHYERTADAWCANLLARRDAIMPVLRETYGAEGARRWFRRWWMFFLACAELFGYRGGDEWHVTHLRFKK